MKQTRLIFVSFFVLSCALFSCVDCSLGPSSEDDYPIFRFTFVDSITGKNLFPDTLGKGKLGKPIIYDNSLDCPDCNVFEINNYFDDEGCIFVLDLGGTEITGSVIFKYENKTYDTIKIEEYKSRNRFICPDKHKFNVYKNNKKILSKCEYGKLYQILK